MANRETHWVRAYWYEPDSELDKRAYASLGDIMRLISDLALIRGELAQVSRSRDAEATAELCRYHYENFLLRTYMLRERVWDVISILVDIKREGTGKERFRAAVLSRLSQSHPEVYSVFSRFNDLIQFDVDLSNVATHRAFLRLGVGLGAAGPYDVIDELLINYDPNNEEGLKIHEGVKVTLRKFARETGKKIQEIIRVTLELQNTLSNMLSSKQR
jgi:hypothetical protein